MTELQHLVSLAFPNIATGPAAAGELVVATEDRSNERVRRIKESFSNGLPNKLKNIYSLFLTTPLGQKTYVKAHLERRCLKINTLKKDDAGMAFSEISESQMTSLIQSMSALNKNRTVKTTDKLVKSLEEHKSQNSNANSNASNSLFRQPYDFYRNKGGFYPRQRFNPPYLFSINMQMQQPCQQRSQSHDAPGSQRPGYPITGKRQPCYVAYGYQSQGQHSATSEDAGNVRLSILCNTLHWSNTVHPETRNNAKIVNNTET